jgi:hypothetical protein
MELAIPEPVWSHEDSQHWDNITSGVPRPPLLDVSISTFNSVI